MPYLRLLRPFTLLPPLLGMLSGAAAAYGTGRATVGGRQAWLFLLLGALMAATLNGASNVLNQVWDVKLDLVNRPERPLPSGQVTRRQAAFFSLLLYGLAIALAFLLVPGDFPEVGVIVLFTAGVTWAYSAPPLRLRRHFLLAPLVIAIPRGLLLKVAGWGVLGPVFSDREPWILGTLFFLFILGAAPAKDFSDMEGDRLGGADSLPLHLGPRQAAWAMAPFYLLPWVLLMLLPTWWVGGKPLLSVDPQGAFWLGLFLLLHGSVTVLHLLRSSATGLAGRRAWRHLYLLMMEAQIGLGALYLCSA